MSKSAWSRAVVAIMAVLVLPAAAGAQSRPLTGSITQGTFEREVKNIEFLEGHSNQGDALCFEPVGAAPASCG